MIEVSLHDAVMGLTTSLDFIGVDTAQHGKRVGHMARRVGRAMGWGDARCDYLLHAGMLHDCGVSRVAEERVLDERLAWKGAERHCVRGADYLADCSIFSDFMDVVRYHHCKWSELSRFDALSFEVRLDANLIHLVDRVDVLLSPYLQAEQLHHEIISQAPLIVERMRRFDDDCFESGLLKAFCRIASTDAFWLSMEPRYLDEELMTFGRNAVPVTLDAESLRGLSRLLHRLISSKSPHTEDHSLRVAAITRHLAHVMGYRDEHLLLIELAGLLHDIGKLRVPSGIIEKPDVLTLEEHSHMARHSYDTFRILRRIFPDSPLPLWAGTHHENLLGLGYPFRYGAAEIAPEARIVSVADIFQALLQDRPYRSRLSGEEVILRMSALVSEGRLDRDVFEVLVRELEHCVRLAVDEPTPDRQP